MKIIEIKNNKKDYLNILLIGDEDENMINKYLDKSEVYGLFINSELLSICAVLKINEDIVEIKNLATYPEFQNKGYATKLLEFIFKKYKNKGYKNIILGTGENEITLNFYKKRGFVETHRVKNFFINNYSHPIIENGKQLIDMVYLKKFLKIS